MQSTQMPPTRPIFVTGAAGFVGSALCRRLVAEGRSVIALDRDFSLGRLDGCDEAEVERVEGDVRDRALVFALAARSSRVVHLAAIADVRHYSDAPLDILEVTILGARNVFEAAHAADVPVVFASSSEALGKNNSGLHERSESVFGPSDESRWSYGVSKLAAEHWAWALARHGLVACGLRYFNVYGPLMDEPGRGRVLAKFVGALRDGEPLRLVDGGQAIRSFCWIDDAVEATARVVLRLDAASELAGRVVHVGRREPVTMKYLAERVLALSGSDVGTRDVPGTQFFGAGFAEIPRRVPDVRFMEATLDFCAETPLDEGLRRVLAHWGLLADDPPDPAPPRIRAIRPRYEADRQLIAKYEASLDAGWTTNNGPHVRAFEAELAAWLGVEEVVATSTGTSALRLAIHSTGHGGAAVLPSFTYVATLNAVERAGLRPVFCDIDPQTFTLCPRHLEVLLGENADVELIVPVSVYGVWPDLAAIEALAAHVGASVVHDAAHAFGTSEGDLRVPGDVAATTFSFHATKVLAAIEGGAVVPRSPDQAELLRALRTHGLGNDPIAQMTGWNAKLDELSAATGRHTLSRMDEILARRRSYEAEIRGAAAALDGVELQRVPERMLSNVQNLVVRTRLSADDLIALLDGRGIEGRRYFSPPLHRLRRLAPQPPLPVTEEVYSRLVCLPLHSRMEPSEIDRLKAALVAADLAVNGAG